MTDRELMQQALSTLEGWAGHGKWVWPESALEQAKRNTAEAIAALRERLAQPEQEPVAWHPIETAPKDRTVLVCRRHSTIPTMAKWNAEYEWFDDLNMDHLYDVTHWMPLPPAPGTSSRQWQGLTDEDVKAPIQKAMQHFGFDPTQYSLGGAATIGFYGLAKKIEAKLREKNT